MRLAPTASSVRREISGSRRGPRVGCENLGKSIVSSQTRVATPTPVRPSVQRVPVMAHTLGAREAESMSQERSQTEIALKIRRDHHTPFSAGAFSPMMDWMTSSPSLIARESQVLTRALLCLF